MSTDLESELTEHYRKLAEYDGDKMPPPPRTAGLVCSVCGRDDGACKCAVRGTPDQEAELARLHEQLRDLQRKINQERLQKAMMAIAVGDMDSAQREVDDATRKPKPQSSLWADQPPAACYHGPCPNCGWPYNQVPPWWWYRNPYQPYWQVNTSDPRPPRAVTWCGSVGVPHV